MAHAWGLHEAAAAGVLDKVQAARPPPKLFARPAYPEGVAAAVKQHKGYPLPRREGAARNAPGAWHFMISYTTKTDRSSLMARELRTGLKDAGFTVWLDIDMDDKSEAAMKEAVGNSMVVIAVITPAVGDPETAYLKRKYCLQELRWAGEMDTQLQPVVHMADKNNIGEFVAMAPEDLQHIGGIDFIDLNMTDKDYWNVGLQKIIKTLRKVYGITAAAAAAGGGGGVHKFSAENPMPRSKLSGQGAEVQPPASKMAANPIAQPGAAEQPHEMI